MSPRIGPTDNCKGSGHRTPHNRDLVALVGVERYGVKVKELASELKKSDDGVSLWARRGARRRKEDPSLAVEARALYEALQEER